MVDCLLDGTGELPRPQERKTRIHYLLAQTRTVVRLADTFQLVSLTVPTDCITANNLDVSHLTSQRICLSSQLFGVTRYLG